jgi:hypothetical protein
VSSLFTATNEATRLAWPCELDVEAELAYRRLNSRRRHQALVGVVTGLADACGAGVLLPHLVVDASGGSFAAARVTTVSN